MKKVISLICALSIACSLCSCGSGNDTKDSSVSDKASSSSVAEDNSPYTVNADFSKGESDAFSISDGWTNGGQFNCTWVKKNVAFTDGHMTLTIDKNYEDSYTGAEYRSNEMCGYGLYEVSMKPISNNGVVSSFFTYTGPSDSNPWDEIDIEFLGKDTTKVQFNYFTDGKGNHEFIYDLGFDASKEFHTYGFKWAEDSIIWYVDGKEVHTATENLPVTPGKIMMNVWNGIGVDGWLNKFDGTVPLTAEYEWARFTEEKALSSSSK